jgi:hypothetical protein
MGTKMERPMDSIRFDRISVFFLRTRYLFPKGDFSSTNRPFDTWPFELIFLISFRCKRILENIKYSVQPILLAHIESQLQTILILFLKLDLFGQTKRITYIKII